MNFERISFRSRESVLSLKINNRLTDFSQNAVFYDLLKYDSRDIANFKS